MTREEAIENLEYLESCSYVDSFEKTEKKALKMAIKALKQEPITDRIEYGTDGNSYKLTISNGKEFKQEPILDKIRAEIEAMPKTYPFWNHIDTYVKDADVIKIIDKYTKEGDA